MSNSKYHFNSIKHQSFVVKFGAQRTHFGYVESVFASPDGGVKVLGLHYFNLVGRVLVADERLIPMLALLTESWSLKRLERLMNWQSSHLLLECCVQVYCHKILVKLN